MSGHSEEVLHDRRPGFTLTDGSDNDNRFGLTQLVQNVWHGSKEAGDGKATVL